MIKKCNYFNCKFKFTIIGYCNHCNKNYCNIHRLMEQHHCAEYDNVISISKELLCKKTIDNSINKKKIVF